MSAVFESKMQWKPSAEAAADSAIGRWMAEAGFETYDAFHAWSVSEPAAFWNSVWDKCGVVGEKGAVLEDGAADAPSALQDSDKMPGAKWFADAQLSFAENMLQRRDDAPAMIFRREDGQRSELSFSSVAKQVAHLQRALKAAGVESGDRVVGYLPNIPEAVVAMLAANSLGAVWSSASPDFGVPGILDRFGQVEPKVLFAADGYLYKDRLHDVRPKLAEVIAGLPTVEKVVMIPYADESATFEGADLWSDFLELGASQPSASAADPDTPEFLRLPFDHPLYVMFSSGTTGKPKCITHGQGGTLLQHLKEHQLHCDLRAGDRMFYFTTTGWMMWNWLVTAMATGATAILWDGNPFHPGPEAIWEMVREERAGWLGTSAKFVDACKKAGYVPPSLPDLKAILSTGSPLVPESFDWLEENVSGAQVASICGGTDLVSCFILGNPTLPVYRGEIQCRGLGMAVEVWNDDGDSLVGEPGELVCTKPFPSMPIGFWGDKDGSKYHSAYFDYFDNIWRHGDWVELTERGGMIIYGRSDATLNPGGVRIGTAEIYRQVEQLAAIEEAVVVGQDTGDGDQRVVLFVRLAEGVELTDELQKEVRTQIRVNATPRHVPAVIAAVPDIPRTRSGKISEIAVRHVLHGRPVKNTEALANPEALEFFLPDGILSL